MPKKKQLVDLKHQKTQNTQTNLKTNLAKKMTKRSNLDWLETMTQIFLQLIEGIYKIQEFQILVLKVKLQAMMNQ